MGPLQETATHCPYCGEPITLLVDASVGEQRYVEDCEVCCRPIEVSVQLSADGEVHVHVQHEDQA